MSYLNRANILYPRHSISEAGYTLIEILVVMLISATALGLLLPSVNDLNRPYIKTNAVAKFMADLGRAQSHALTVGCLVDFTLDNHGYTFHCAYATDEAICPDNESQACKIFTEELDNRIEIIPDPIDNVVWHFNSRGLLVDDDNLLTEAELDFGYLVDGSEDTYDHFADAEVLTTGVVNFIMS